METTIIMRRRPIWIWMTLCVLMSCSRTYYTRTDKVIQPKFQFPYDMGNVMVLNRSKAHIKGLSFDNGLKNVSYSESFTKRASAVFPVSKTVSRRAIDHSSNDKPAPQLAHQQQKTYAQGHDGLMSLDQYRPFELREYESFDKHQLDELGRDYYISAERCTQRYGLEVLWRLYRVSDGTVLFEAPYLFEEEQVFEARTRKSVNEKIDTLDQISLPEIENDIINMMKLDFHPREIQSNWLYYKKGDPIIEKSADMIAADRFKAAIHYLESNLSRINKEKKKARAMVNLATSYYLNGDKESAIRILNEPLVRKKIEKSKYLRSKILKE